MTLASFIADTATLTTDTIKTWKQRGVDISATPFPSEAISAKLKFLREHVAAYAEEKKLDLSTPVVSISREKIGDYGIGELLVLSTGHRLAAAACEFRVMEEPLEKPVAEAAAPVRRDSKGRFVKKTSKKSDNFRGIIDYSPAEVDDAIASFLGQF